MQPSCRWARGCWGASWLRSRWGVEETDNAQLQTHVEEISSRASGTIAARLDGVDTALTAPRQPRAVPGSGEGSRCTALWQALGPVGPGNGAAVLAGESWRARRSATCCGQGWEEPAQPGSVPWATSQSSASRLSSRAGERYTDQPILGVGLQGRPTQRSDKPGRLSGKPLRLFDPPAGP